MNGVDRTKFDPRAAAPYKGRQVRWHGQPGSFRDDAQGNLVWTPNTGATFGSNGIEDITGKLGASTGQAGGMQYQYDPATGGVISTGGAPTAGAPPPPTSGPGQQGPPAPPPAGPGQQPQPPGPTTPEVGAPKVAPGTGGADPSAYMYQRTPAYQNFQTAFGTAFGDPGYQAKYDFNTDNTVDYSDLVGEQGFAARFNRGDQTFIDPITHAQQLGGMYSEETGYMSAEQAAEKAKTDSIDNSIQSMIATAGDQRTATGQPYSPEYYSRYQDGYRTYLQGLSDAQRANAFKAPHKTYRNYVIDQLEVTPELGNVLRGIWDDKDIQAIAQSIISGEGILSLEHINSIPEELLSGSRKSHIEKIVGEAATRLPPGQAANLPFALRMTRSSNLLTQAEEERLISRSERKAFSEYVSTLSMAEQNNAVNNPLVAISQFLNRTLATKPAGAAGDPSGEGTDLDPNIQGAGVSEDPFAEIIDSLAVQLRMVDPGQQIESERMLRSALADQGYTPEQIEQIFQKATDLALDLTENEQNVFDQLQAGTFDEDATYAQLLEAGYTAQAARNLIIRATARYQKSLTPVDDGVDDGVDEGFPPGWVDADNDGFDDNTNLDIDGNPKLDTWLDVDSDGYDDITGLDRQGYPKDKTQTRPKFPDTDDNIQNILTYLQETLTQTEGIDDIAVNELADFSRSSKRAQEQLLEDLNRLGLTVAGSGDAEAALGEFAAGVLAEKRQIRADSAVRLRENIDSLIKATGLQVSQTEADARIKMLQDSIESRDQLALFNGLIAVLGPDALDLLGPIGEKIKEETKKAGNRLWDWGKNALGLGDDVIAGTEAYKNLKKLLPDKTDKEIIELLKRTIEGQEEIDSLTVVRLPDGTEITWEELEPSIVERSGPSQPEQPGESFDYDRWSEYGLIDPGQAAINKEQVTSIIDDIGDIKELEYDSRSSTRLSTQTLWALQSMDLNGDNMISSGEVVEFMSLYPEEIQTVQTYFDQHPDIERNRDGDIRRKGGKTGWAKFGSFVGAIILQAGRSIQSGGNKYTKRSDGEVIVELVES